MNSEGSKRNFPNEIEHGLIKLLGRDVVVDGDRDRYERGYRYGAGKAAAIVRPGNVDEVRAVVRHCRQSKLEIVAQGAHTGLVGAATPDGSGGQVVVSLERMAAIFDYCPVDRTVSCQAGTLLSTVNALAAPDELSLPIDLGADPSIGGMVATNTGGAKLLRYGDMRSNLLGLEAVLFNDDATILSDLAGLRKDNTGFDTKQLFVGTGGHMGIITAATVELSPVPRQSASALLVPGCLSDAPAITARLESNLGELLVACEGMSGDAIRLALEHHPTLRNPFKSGNIPPFTMLVEAASSVAPGRGIDIESVLADALWSMMESDNVHLDDVLVTTSNDFFNIRHSISDGLSRAGRVVAFDISTRRSRLPQLIEQLIVLTGKHLPNSVPCYFGHFGDGGVHFNPVIQDEADEDVLALRDAVYALVQEKFDGSVSAEHGVGPHNILYYQRHVVTWKQSVMFDIARMLRS